MKYTNPDEIIVPAEQTQDGEALTLWHVLRSLIEDELYGLDFLETLEEQIKEGSFDWTGGSLPDWEAKCREIRAEYSDRIGQVVSRSNNKILDVLDEGTNDLFQEM